MRLRLSLLCGAMLALAWSARADDAATNAVPAIPAPPTAASLVEQATDDEASGKLDRARAEVAAALAIDAKNTAALELRGSIYMEEKFWDLATRDFTTLNRISPDPAYQYKLAQIKFLQREFDDARPLYAAMKDDPRLGDLASYKVFICDLFGAHETIAARDLATLDPAGDKPSFYYGRAIWAEAQHDQATANRLDAQAAGRFGDAMCAPYRSVYSEARLFHLFAATFETRDGRKFADARASLEDDGLRVSTQNGWVTVPLSQLPDDLSPFPMDLRTQIDLHRNAEREKDAQAAAVSFTTRSGKSYSLARWTLEFSGLAVLTPKGWMSVPFDELPDDLSAFPADAQKQIAEKRKEAAAVEELTPTVTFTTKEGKAFTAVRAWLGDDGVGITTPDGPITIPFTDLPDDLSPFPSVWCVKIKERLKSDAGSGEAVAVVSFTTAKGVAYHDVRAALGTNGVLVATDQGWVTVPFADLPADVTALPAGWRPIIADWLKSSAGDMSGIHVVSFTTMRGKHYDQVRATLQDTGLEVLSPDGWVAIAFDQLPGDLSPFPAAWRETIAARQKGAAAPKD